jgi:hypothetical protein
MLRIVPSMEAGGAMSVPSEPCTRLVRWGGEIWSATSPTAPGQSTTLTDKTTQSMPETQQA